MTDTTPAPSTFRTSLTAVLDAVEAAGLRPSVVTCAFGTDITLITRPHASWDQALRLFSDLGAPAPGLTRATVDSQETVRVAGPLPDHGVQHLSIVIDL